MSDEKKEPRLGTLKNLWEMEELFTDFRYMFGEN